MIGERSQLRPHRIGLIQDSSPGPEPAAISVRPRVTISDIDAEQVKGPVQPQE
jgi:hypothetical protein